MEGDVKEHKVEKSPSRRPRSATTGLPKRRLKKNRALDYVSSVKKRSVAYILNTVQRKLKRLLSDVTEHSPDEIQRALSNPAAEKVLKRRITEGSIEMVDPESQRPVFQRQMSKIGEKGYRAGAESPGGASEYDHASSRGVVEPDQAELVSKANDSIRLLSDFHVLTFCLPFFPTLCIESELSGHERDRRRGQC